MFNIKEGKVEWCIIKGKLQKLFLRFNLIIKIIKTFQKYSVYLSSTNNILIPFVHVFLKTINFIIAKVVNCDWCIIKWCQCEINVILITIYHLKCREIYYVHSIVIKIKVFVHILIYLRPQISFRKKYTNG